MKEIKKNLSKWMYWFLLAISVILVYKVLDNFTKKEKIRNETNLMECKWNKSMLSQRI